MAVEVRSLYLTSTQRGWFHRGRSMACEGCNDLVQVVEICQPKDLRQVIRVARANLADGTIVEERDRFALAMAPPFQTIEENGPWPDYIDVTFRCAHCGQLFRLDAETYHGAGGRWRPVGQNLSSPDPG